jgi:pimeloyl-ACP methyl ester carboxylesterase
MPEDRIPELAINEAIAREGRAATRNRIPKSAALAELLRLITSPVFWTFGMPRGDGHSVFVIPGFGAGDLHYGALRSWLRRLGYRAIKSGLSFNPGWTEDIVDGLGNRAEAEFRHTSARVTLIGHSLGGLQARSVAQRWPGAIRHLITLGAPLMYTGGSVPSTVAFTSIYTAMDLAYEPVAGEAHARNIEVAGAHDLLAVNRQVYELISATLAM